MIKGFAVTPVVLGRIGIGEIVEQNGKRLPRKLNHIVLTSTHQVDGAWKSHPEMQRLIEEQKNAGAVDPDKLRSIPVRILFDRPESNFNSQYTCFSDKGRMLCSGNGGLARRLAPASPLGVEEVPCPGPEICQYGQQNRCKQFARLIIGLESSFEGDPFSGFMFRTTSRNSINALSSRLKDYSAALNGKMAGMPCNLVMRAKSTSASYRKPIFYLDLEPREGFMSAANEAFRFHESWSAAGLNRDRLEQAVEDGYALSAFSESTEDGEEIIEEFFFDDVDENIESSANQGNEKGSSSGKPSDGEKRPKNQKTTNQVALISLEQSAELSGLLISADKSLASMMNWLGRQEADSLDSLTEKEAARAIEALNREMQKKSAQSSPSVATVTTPPSSAKSKAQEKAEASFF